MEINFWDIYYPVLAAFATATIFFEGVHFVIGLITAKRQLKRIQEQAKLMVEQGGGLPGVGDPSPMMMFDMGPNMYGGGPFPPTVSGSADDDRGHGQYL